VVSIIWNFNGLSAHDIEQRMVYTEERVLTTTVNDIQHIESNSYDGIGIIKVFFSRVLRFQQPSPKSLLFRRRSCDNCHPGRRRL
jgi:multidrug efflux pump subunit AcrB